MLDCVLKTIPISARLPGRFYRLQIQLWPTKVFARDDVNGIVYAGEGCWGAPIRAANDTKSWTRDAESVNQINWIFVEKDKMEVRKILYENVEEVKELNENDRFSMPENIQLWTPSNGSLCEIKPRP